MLTEGPSGGAELIPVLIDFSVAKFFREHSEAQDLNNHKLDKNKFSKKAGNFKNSKSSKAGKRKAGNNGGQDDADNNNKQQTTELGTATYVAPEIAKGAASYNEKADVYSLGVVFYEVQSRRNFRIRIFSLLF